MFNMVKPHRVKNKQAVESYTGLYSPSYHGCKEVKLSLIQGFLTT